MLIRPAAPESGLNFPEFRLPFQWTKTRTLPATNIKFSARTQGAAAEPRRRGRYGGTSLINVSRTCCWTWIWTFWLVVTRDSCALTKKQCGTSWYGDRHWVFLVISYTVIEFVSIGLGYLQNLWILYPFQSFNKNPSLPALCLLISCLVVVTERLKMADLSWVHSTKHDTLIMQLH